MASSPPDATSPLELQAARVSVVVPTYNRAAVVGRAIDSVLAQTFGDFELIVVDDASTDETSALLASYSDPRLIALVHDTNRGGGASRNTAIDVAKGEFVAFLDSDCEFLHHYLEVVVARFDEDTIGEIGVVVVDHVRVIGQTEELRPAGLLNRDGLLSLEQNISSSAAVVRRVCLEPGLRFDAATKHIDDRDFFMQIAEHYRFATIAKPLVRFPRHEGPRMNIPSTQLVLRQRLLAKHFDELAGRPRMLARHHLAIGHIHLALGDHQSARRAFGASIRARPRSWRAWTWYSVTLLGGRSPSVRTALKGYAGRLRSAFSLFKPGR